MCDIFSPVLTNGQLNPWVEGEKLGTHPSRKLLKHSNSKPHINSIQKQSKVNAYDDGEPLLLMLLKQKSEKQKSEEISRNRKYISCVIKTVHFAVKQHWSLDSVPELVDHVDNLGNIDINSYCQHHPNLKYTSTASVTEVLESTNIYLETKLLDK
ncbi:hypothetical protein DPMN_085653 [Dreissena polymorpha]|uniref:Uncharacterized protein n=1 Tax=Dreissena polymorpha TaxID=45954 RepID=A0A9D3YHE2_DREPO|nr:hypothetical protein DPMN_085653 [Dreissena polymorpha]